MAINEAKPIFFNSPLSLALLGFEWQPAAQAISKTGC
jgi:hypothetical protein